MAGGGASGIVGDQSIRTRGIGLQIGQNKGGLGRIEDVRTVELPLIDQRQTASGTSAQNSASPGDSILTARLDRDARRNFNGQAGLAARGRSVRVANLDRIEPAMAAVTDGMMYMTLVAPLILRPANCH